MRNPNCTGKHSCATPSQLRKTERIFTQMLRSDAKIEQKSRCVYCRDRMMMATAEHLQPRSRGGSTVRQNIKAACKPCNQAKGNGSEAWFRRTLHQGIENIPIGEMAITSAWIRFRLNRRVERQYWWMTLLMNAGWLGK